MGVGVVFGDGECPPTPLLDLRYRRTVVISNRVEKRTQVGGEGFDRLIGVFRAVVKKVDLRNAVGLQVLGKIAEGR